MHIVFKYLFAGLRSGVEPGDVSYIYLADEDGELPLAGEVIERSPCTVRGHLKPNGS